MDHRTWLGTLAEAKTASKLIEAQFEVFVQVGGKASFDLIAHKNNKLFRISVKGTSFKDRNAWTFQIGSVRSNRTENKIYRFDSGLCDVLACYIQPLDKVCFLLSKEIEVGRSLAIRELPSNNSRKNLLIDQLLDPNRMLEL